MFDVDFNDWREALRADSWTNLVTGLGDPNRDKGAGSQWSPEIQLHMMQLTDMFNFDAIAKRIVCAMPEECFREGYTLHASAPDRTEYLRAEADNRGLDQVFQEADTWARLYGGSAIMPEIVDGKSLQEPLDPYTVRHVGRLEIFDRRYVFPYTYYKSDGSDNLLRPEIYILTSLSGKVRYVHESRLIIFRGAMTDPLTRARNLSWDLSTLDAPIEAVKGFWESFNASKTMIQEASVGVVKIKGLIAALAGPNRDKLEKRLSLMDQAKSLVRALVLEAGDGSSAGESFERVAMQLAGVPELLDRFANILAASTGIPVTRIMGQAPAGLNATGEADLRMWYDSCRSYQNRSLQPKMLRLLRLMCCAQGWHSEQVKVEFSPLWQESPKERADRRKTIADTDAVYLTNMVVSPERVAANRFGPVYSDEMIEPEPTGDAPAAADVAAYKQALAAAQPGKTPQLPEGHSEQ